MNRRNLLEAAAVSAALLGTAPAAYARRRPEGRSTIAAADGTQLFVRDWGDGPPLVFLGGWGLTSDFWSYVMVPLSGSGFRCVAYDRRGHGRSADPGRGYDYDTLADDLGSVLQALDLKEVTLVAHSMAGGEAVRHLSRARTRRVARLVLIGTTLPFLTRTADNPEGIDPAAFERLRGSMMKDFPKWLRDNSRPFVMPDTSDALIEWGMQKTLQTSLQAAIECNRALTRTDFRAELARLELPILIIHGDRDVSAPLPLTAQRTAKLLPHAQLKIYPSAPHGIPLTHASELEEDLVAFVRG